MEMNKCVCGKTPGMNRWVSEYDGRMQKHRVECDCGICGPWAGTETGSIAAWNALPRANDSKYRRALDLLGVPAQSLKDPDKAPPLRIDVRMAREVMEVVDG